MRLNFPLLDGGWFDPPPPVAGPDPAESSLGSKRRPRHYHDGCKPGVWSPEWREHLEQLAKRAEAGLPVTTGYRPAQAAGIDAD